MFEEALRTTIEISLGVSAVILLLLVTKPLLDKRYAAKWRYWVWLILALRLIFPFRLPLMQTPLSLPVPEQEIVYQVDENRIPEIPMPTVPRENDGQTVSQSATAPQIENDEIQTEKSQKAGVRTISIAALAAAVWCGGVVLFLIWNIAVYLSFRGQIRRRGKMVTALPSLLILRKIRSELKIKRKIRLMIFSGLDSPVMTGMISPVILLPDMAYTEEELSMILRHELVHWKRRDIWYKFVLLLANAVHWFNPLVWVMARQADQDIEISCDDAVLAGKNELFRQQYGQALLHVLRTGVTRRNTIFSTRFSASRKTLKRRFSNLLKASRKRSGKIALCVVLVAAIFAGSLVACQQTDSASKQPDLAASSFGPPASTANNRPGEKIDPSEYSSLSRTYLFPFASLSDSIWSNPDEIHFSLFDFAIQGLYGFYDYSPSMDGETETYLDFSVLFDTENRQDVLDDCIDQDLIQEEEDQQGTPYGRVDSRWRFPAQDIENYITQYFDLPPEYWEEILRVDEAYDAQNHTYAYNTRYLSSCLPYLTEARQEGDFLFLYYDIINFYGFTQEQLDQFLDTPFMSGNRRVLTIRLMEDGSFRYESCEVDEGYQPVDENQFYFLLSQYLLPYGGLVYEDDWTNVTQLSDTAFLQIALQSRYHRYADGLDYVALFGDSMAPLTRDIHASSDDMVADLIILPDGRPVCPGAGIHNSWRYFENSYDAETGDYLDQEKIALEKAGVQYGEGYLSEYGEYGYTFPEGFSLPHPPLLPRITAAARQGEHLAVWFDLLDASTAQNQTYEEFLAGEPPLVCKKKLMMKISEQGLPVYLSCVEYDHSLAANGMEPVPVSILQGEKPVSRIQTFSFYVQSAVTGEILSPTNLLQYGAPTEGRVIAAQEGGSEGYVIGSFSFPYERQGWGSISDLPDGTFCYTNGKQLFFYDAATLEPLEQKLDFQTPTEPYWHIASVYYDQSLHHYAVLYHVSSFTPSKPAEAVPWKIWDELNPESNVHLEIQQFDHNGKFLGRFQTNLPSYEANALSVCQPGWYDNGVLGFQNQTWGGYAAYDFSAEKLASFSGKPILKDGVVLLYRAEYNNDSEIYTYEWIEGQQSLYQTSSTRTLSSLTEENADGELISLDASRKTASIRFGNIQHDIDFLSGTVEESYIIDENQLTEENLTHTSPDGRYEVYRIAHSAGGDGWADEFLCRDCVSGQVQQLGILSAMKIGGITSKNEFIYHEGHALYSIDLATCERRQPIKALSAPVDWQYQPGDPYLLDFVYDAENHVIIAECVDWFDIYAEDFDINAIEETLYLLVFDEDGNQQKRIDTTVPAGANLKAYGPTGCDLILQSDGLYLEKGSYGPIPYLE